MTLLNLKLSADVEDFIHCGCRSEYTKNTHYSGYPTESLECYSTSHPSVYKCRTRRDPSSRLLGPSPDPRTGRPTQTPNIDYAGYDPHSSLAWRPYCFPQFPHLSLANFKPPFSEPQASSIIISLWQTVWCFKAGVKSPKRRTLVHAIYTCGRWV